METIIKEFQLNIADFENGVLEKQGLIPVNDIGVQNLISGNYYIKATILNKNIDIKIEINYIKKFKCVRCLKDFENEKRIVDFAEAIKSNKKEDEETNIIFYEDKVLDILNYIRDIIIINDDMISLCNEDCKGLCQICGNDLNIKECECKDKKTSNVFDKIFKNKVDLKS